MRTRRKSDLESFEADLRDMDRLAGFVMQGSVEVKFTQLNQRLERRVWLWNVNTFNIGRRPDAKAFAFTPDSPFTAEGIAKCEMKAVEFHARMKTIGQRLHHLLPHKRLGPMGRNVDKDDNGDNDRKDAATHPEWPAGYASAYRCADLSLPHLFGWMPFFRPEQPFSD